MEEQKQIVVGKRQGYKRRVGAVQILIVGREHRMHGLMHASQSHVPER